MQGVLGKHDRDLPCAIRSITDDCRSFNWCIDLQSGPFCHPDYTDEDDSGNLLDLFFSFSGGQPAWFRAGILPLHADKLILDEWSFYLGFYGSESRAQELSTSLDDCISPSGKLFEMLEDLDHIYLIRVDDGWWEAYSSNPGIVSRLHDDWNGSQIANSHWFLPATELRRPDLG